MSASRASWRWPLKVALASGIARASRLPVVGALAGRRRRPLILAYHRVVEDFAAAARTELPSMLITARCSSAISSGSDAGSVRPPRRDRCAAADGVPFDDQGGGVGDHVRAMATASVRARLPYAQAKGNAVGRLRRDRPRRPRPLADHTSSTHSRPSVCAMGRPRRELLAMLGDLKMRQGMCSRRARRP